MIQMNLFTKQKHTHRLREHHSLREQTYGYQEGRAGGRDRLGAWDWHIHTAVFKIDNQGLPGRPVVETSPSNAGGVGSIPGWGAKISHALQPKNQNIKRKQYCNKFNKDFKNGPHQ